jgi:PAS domain S-box-containing protein
VNLSRLSAEPVGNASTVSDLDDFFENGVVALHLVGPDGTILRANRAELDLLGYARDEYIGRNIADFHADADTINEILTRLGRGETLDRFPARLRAKDGSIKHVLISSNVQFRNGAFVNTRCFTLDVTDAQAARALLREQDQRLAATYNHASIGIAEADETGRHLRVNDALCKITGYTAEELLQRSFFGNTHPDDRSEDHAMYARQIAGELDTYTVEKRYVKKDGTSAAVRVSASAVRDSEGVFLYGVRVIQDVTDERRARDVLKDRERWFRELLEFLPAAVYTTDAEGRINFFNKAAVELAGRAPALGDMWCVTWKLYHPDGTPLPHDECPMAVALKEKRPVRGAEAIAERPDGTRVPFIPFPTPLRNSDGEVVGAVNMLVDISERRQSETAQRVLVNELNHRVKNNMQMLDSLLKVALRKTANKEAQAALADACRRVATMAAAQRVLYEAGSISFDAADFVRSVCSTAAQAFEDGIAIEIGDIAGQLSNDVAMPLALILNELLVNAVKYGINGAHAGTVHVGMEDDGECYQLFVKDNGPGFDLEETRHRSSGLDIVSGLARQIGGKFIVERANGARCVVRFPHASSIH